MRTVKCCVFLLEGLRILFSVGSNVTLSGLNWSRVECEVCTFFASRRKVSRLCRTCKRSLTSCCFSGQKHLSLISSNFELENR